MTSPTYSDCDCSCTVCTLDWVVPGLAGWMEGLAPVVTGIGEAVMLGAVGEGEGSTLNGFSSNTSKTDIKSRYSFNCIVSRIVIVGSWAYQI
jgi:hypothetical protein